tara:strand:+ start:7 stop:1326 length:1320 start_codon:yes stop_codon:yes gene_type:complete
MAITYHAGRRLQGSSTDRESQSLTTTQLVWSTTGSVGYTLSLGNTKVTKTAGASWTNSSAMSTASFTVGTKFSVEFSRDDIVSSSMTGLVKSQTTGLSAPFSIYMAGSYFQIYESSSSILTLAGTPEISDRYKIEVEVDGTVKYYMDDGGTGTWALKYTSLSTASGTYFVNVSSHATNSTAILGNSIVTTTTDLTPTNVQTGSRFEETDTRKMYHYTDPITFEDDFTSYATQGAADAVWVEDETGKVAVNITDNDIDFNLKTETTAHGINYDFGVGNVSDTEWIIRYKMNLTTVNTTVMYTYWGLSSVSGSGTSTTRDFIGFNTTGTSFYGHDRDGADDTGGGDNSQSYTLLTGTDYYVTIKRTSATAYAYTLQTGSFSGTTVVNGTGTCASTIVGLRYFNCRNLNNQTTAGNLIGTIDDFEFYNGVTSTDNTWSEEGT